MRWVRPGEKDVISTVQSKGGFITPRSVTRKKLGEVSCPAEVAGRNSVGNMFGVTTSTVVIP